MTTELWTWDDLVIAAEGAAEGLASGPITGVSIDTRTLAPGDLFVALKDARDGHEFVSAAFAKGAAAALVSIDYARRAGEGALVRVDDPQQGLERLAVAARRRLSPDARVVAVTGSAGKTGTKEMLRLGLSRFGPTHASDKSYNNHWGVPLSLARMPAESRFAAFEIGMNHAGEIRPLTRMVRPHVAIVTSVEPVHLAYFRSIEEIALAKAEIFEGLEPGGAAVINRDNPHFELLAARARDAGANVIGFGVANSSQAQLRRFGQKDERALMLLYFDGETDGVPCELAAQGVHHAMNATAVLAAVRAVGADVRVAASALRDFEPAAGRGGRLTLLVPGGDLLLIDESYNANPASMRAALATLANVPRGTFPRRIAVLGDMLELGDQSGALHEGLVEPIERAAVDLVFASGPHMKTLFAALPSSRRGAWAETSEGLRDPLLAAARAGDAVMIKGSLGLRMALLVEALKATFASSGARAAETA